MSEQVKQNMVKRILIDAREFGRGRLTGIGRVLEGLTDALAESDDIKQIVLAVSFDNDVPLRLRNRDKIEVERIPVAFLKSEKALSSLSYQGFSLFISVYPKLPLFGCRCTSVHTVHDVLDLTDPAYKRQLRVFADGLRLRTALKRASLTWYDSAWSLEETRRHVGFEGKNPKVRYPGLHEMFKPDRLKEEDNVLKRYGLSPGYILVIGNGLPHKNLGALLSIADHLARRIVFVGVSEKNQRFWKSRFPARQQIWIKYAREEDLATIIRKSFCLAQPSTAEGYGYPPLEATACGVPAVVSNIPVLIETTGGCALAADPSNPKAWLEAFQVLEDKAIYQKQIEKGLKWAERFRGRKGWEKHVFDIVELMRVN